MSRIRSIKPDFWTDEKIVELDPFARLLFIGLWNFADDEGRMVCSPKRIKMQILPADPAEIPRLLDELERQSLVRRYVVEDIEYLQIVNFAKHQKVDKRYPSKLPPPPTNPTHSRRIPPNAADGMEWNGMERTTPAVVIKTTSAASEPAAGAVPADAGNPETQPPELTGAASPPDAPPEPPAPPRLTPPPGSPFKPVTAGLTIDALRVTPGVGTDLHEATGALWAVLAANGCRGTASHPAVIELARQGVTIAELRAAIADARKSSTAQLNPAYLAAIVERRRAEGPAKAGKGAKWASDDGALDAKARELGIKPRSGETYHDLRTRVRDHLERQAAGAVR